MRCLLTWLDTFLDNGLFLVDGAADIGAHEVMDDALGDAELAVLCCDDASLAVLDETHLALDDLEEFVALLVPMGAGGPGAAGGEVESAMGFFLVVEVDCNDARSALDGQLVEGGGLAAVVLVLLAGSGHCHFGGLGNDEVAIEADVQQLVRVTRWPSLADDAGEMPKGKRLAVRANI